MTVLYLLIVFWCTFVVLLVPIVYKLLVWRYDYWRSRNVDGPAPTFILGNMAEMFTKKHHMGAHFKHLYEKTKHLPYAGIYLFHRPAVMVNHPDLIKRVLVKDFVHFTDHGFHFDRRTQPLLNHLFNVNGAKWKAIRSKLSPAFTPNKLKRMMDKVVVCGDELSKYLDKFARIGVEVDIKDAVSKFTMDVILSCAFGVDSNSFERPDGEFRTMGGKVFEVTTKRRIKMFIALFIPELHRIINGRVLDQDVADFFIRTIDDIVKYRERNNIVKNDLLQFLMNLRDDSDDVAEDYIDTLPMKENETLDLHLSMIEMTSQAFGFFAGGFETASTSLGFLFYELAKSPEVRAKLTREIDETLKKHDDRITYEMFGEMKYLERVIEESLRMYPPIPQLFRVCTEEYAIPDSDVVIEKGTPIVMSPLGIQNDPNIYPDPEVFDPDRFAETTRNSCAFLTFGEGPRICIGMPLALLQMRVAVISILRYYDVEIGQKKENTLKVVNKSMLMAPKDMMLKLKRRVL